MMSDFRGGGGGSKMTLKNRTLEGNKIEGTPILKLAMVKRLREYIRLKNDKSNAERI